MRDLVAEERHAEADLSQETARQLLRNMYLVRAFEEQAERSYAEGKIHGTMHLSIGQEASSVGSISVLRKGDYILCHHRGHGHCIAMGADINTMMAEFYGKETGYCRGRGGSMHIADIDGGNLGANGVVGGGLPLAVGVGIGLKMQSEGRILLSFFGEGAASNGAFHEAMQLAVLFHVPVVFICENNQYAMSFPARKLGTSERIASFALVYGMPGKAVDGNDVLAVRAAVRIAVDLARRGGGPSLVVSDTYRYRGHSKSDRNLYRTQQEIDEWKQKDPIPRFRDWACQAGMLGRDEANKIMEQVYVEIESARKYAEDAPEPSIETIEDGVFAP